MSRRNGSKKRPPGLPVEWNDRDMQAGILALWGMSTYYIEQATSLSVGQINYRIKVLGFIGARKAYRNGENIAAQYVLSHVKNNVVVPVVNEAVQRRKAQAQKGAKT